MKMTRPMEVRLLAALTVCVVATGCGGPPEELETARQESLGTVEQAASCAICPPDISIWRDTPGYTRTCYCEGTSGSAWGTDIYTDDSNICAAARHAGVIPAGGGAVTVKNGPGRSSYTGSSRNGVTTYSYGSWPGSITLTSAVMNCTQACPSNLASYRGQNGTVVTCTCAAENTLAGGVWGTGTYTDDSDLCRSAVHAGRITTAGGTVNAVIRGGLSSYVGSTQNGVTSSSYTSWYGSFTFQ
jgi:hypothetical protein